MAGARPAARAGRAPTLDLFGVTPPPALHGCVTPSWHAYVRFQRVCAAQIAKARSRHGKRRQIIALRTATVHAALEAGRAA